MNRHAKVGDVRDPIKQPISCNQAWLLNVNMFFIITSLRSVITYCVGTDLSDLLSKACSKIARPSSIGMLLYIDSISTEIGMVFSGRSPLSLKALNLRSISGVSFIKESIFLS